MMINLILFILIVISIIVITIMYLHSVQINNTETKYNIVIRLLIISLLTLMFLENKQQSGYLSQITNSITTYMSDVGKTMMNFIDSRTKDINDRLDEIDNKTNSIDEKLTGINKDIQSVNENINNSRNSVIMQVNEVRSSIIIEIQNYIQQQIEKWFENNTKIGPGGIQIIW